MESNSGPGAAVMWGRFWWAKDKRAWNRSGADTPGPSPEPAPVAGPDTPADGRADEIAEFLARFYTHQQC